MKVSMDLGLAWKLNEERRRSKSVSWPSNGNWSKVKSYFPN